MSSTEPATAEPEPAGSTPAESSPAERVRHFAELFHEEGELDGWLVATVRTHAGEVPLTLADLRELVRPRTPAAPAEFHDADVLRETFLTLVDDVGALDFTGAAGVEAPSWGPLAEEDIAEAPGALDALAEGARLISTAVRDARRYRDYRTHADRTLDTLGDER